MSGGEYLKKENIYPQIIKHTEYRAELVKIHQFLVTVVKIKNVKDKDYIKNYQREKKACLQRNSN